MNKQEIRKDLERVFLEKDYASNTINLSEDFMKTDTFSHILDVAASVISQAKTVKALLVIYLNVGNGEKEAAEEFLNVYIKNFSGLQKNLNAQGISCLWFPVRGDSPTKVELINLPE